MLKTPTLADLQSEFKTLAASMELETDVLGEGPLLSAIAIVGEGPGETEVRTNRAFTGGAGRLLFDALRRYGLHRANTYVTNVVKRQISLSRTGDERHIVHRDELQKWFGLLKWELSHLPNLRFVLVLGNYAMEALTGNTGITNWRGSVVDCVTHTDQNEPKHFKSVLTINPAYAIREPKMEPMFLSDIHKLDLLNRNVFKAHEVEAIINPDFKTAMVWLRDAAKKATPIAWDIEVINGQTACHGFANDANSGICINLRDGVTNRYTLQEEADILLRIQEIVNAPQTRIIAQNGQFDSYWSWLKDGLKVPIWFDTLLAHHCLFPQLPHSLAFQVAQYTTHAYYKDEGKFWKEGGDINVFWTYNCKDTALTYACYEKETVELKSQGLERFFHDHVMKAHPHLVRATVEGVAIDPTVKTEIIADVGNEVEAAKADFLKWVHELTGDRDYNPNPDSWQQLQKLFFEVLNLRGRGRSTDENNRRHIMKDPGTSPTAREMLTALDKYKEANKFLGVYAESRPGADNRMRTVYKLNGTTNAPGRLSSAGLLDGQGSNLQNWPPRARKMIVADPGMVFVYFDLKQAEAVVVAYRANIPKWKEQFRQALIDGKYDAHRAMAAEMYKKPYDEVPTKDTFVDANGVEQYTIRYIAKRCRHGLNYRMQTERLSEVTGLPYHEARKAFMLYHSANPELQRWWESQERDFRKTRTIYNGLGRRFKVIQRLDEEVMASIVAFYPQSTIGDKITQVWYQAEEDDKWPTNARVCLDVHDNLVALVSEAKAKTVLSILKRYAESPIMIQDVYNNKPEPVVIAADLKMSTLDIIDKKTKKVIARDKYHRWSNMKEVTL